MFMVKKRDISSHTYKDRHYEVVWACTKETKKKGVKKTNATALPFLSGGRIWTKSCYIILSTT